MELLNTTGVPLIGIEIFDHRGKKVKVKTRCELCAFVDVVELESGDYLKCTKSGLMTIDHGICNDFNITRLMLEGIYCGCIS